MKAATHLAVNIRPVSAKNRTPAIKTGVRVFRFTTKAAIYGNILLRDTPISLAPAKVREVVIQLYTGARVQTVPLIRMPAPTVRCLWGAGILFTPEPRRAV